MFWAVAMSTVESEFLSRMERIKRVDSEAYDQLNKMNPSTWCRAYFKPDKACEAVENGIAECFNSIIPEARKKPLITVLEEIRLYLMDRFYKMAQKADRWESDVCPAVVKKMNKFGETIRNWMVCPSGVNAFETRTVGCLSFHQTTPPIARRMPGRPSIKRRRHVSEVGDRHFQVGRARTTKCTNNQEKGHNKVSCKKPFVSLESKPKKNMGRPRMDPDVSHWTRGGHIGLRRGGRGGNTRGGSQRGKSNRGGNIRGESSGAGLEEDANFVDVKETQVETEHVYVQDTIRDMRTSEYTDEEIMDCLGLTNEEFIDIINIKDIPVQFNDMPITDEEADEEAIAGNQEEAVEDVAAVQRAAVLRVRRRPSERITKKKLAKKIVDKYGTGTTSEKAVRLE
ncbi:hypothetical protein LXL04_013046 [Taraxacum kok-saghyz]